MGTIYFCAGSAIFFYLLFRSRLIPRAVSVFGLAATNLSFVDALIRIGAPGFAPYLAYSGALLLLAETVTGGWLLFAGSLRMPLTRRSNPLDVGG